MKTNTQQAEEGEIQEPSDDAEPEAGEAGKAPKPQVDADDETGGVVVREHVRRPRKERREERQNDEVTRLREENERMRRDFDNHRQSTELTLQQLRQGTQQIQADDPHKTRMRSIRAEQELIQTQVRSSQDATEVQRLRERFYTLNDEADDLRETRITERAAAVARQAAAQASQSGQGEEAILRAEFPEVIPSSNQRPNDRQLKVLRYASGLYTTMTADGAPETIETSRKAMQQAAEKFGFRRATAPAPSLTQQQRFGSLPIQAGQMTTRNETRLNKEQMKMAKTRWPDVAEEQAYINLTRALADLDRREKNGGNDEIGG